MKESARPDLLVLHTSDAVGTVAASHGDRLAVQCLDPAGQHARSVLGAVESALDELERQLTDLKGIVVTLGPGSFTGIRIGLATAQGLAAALRWEVLACDALKAEAAALQQVQGPVAIVLDARRNEVYAALYDLQATVPRELRSPFCAPPAAAARLLSESLQQATAGGPELTLSGSGASLLRSHLEAHVRRLHHVEPAGRKEVARALLRLGREGACETMKPEELEPLYLRQSDAEIRRQSENGPA